MLSNICPKSNFRPLPIARNAATISNALLTARHANWKPTRWHQTLINGIYIEAIVDGVLQIFRCLDLSHELVRANVRKDRYSILNSIRAHELEGIDVAESVLHMGVKAIVDEVL